MTTTGPRRPPGSAGAVVAAVPPGSLPGTPAEPDGAPVPFGAFVARMNARRLLVVQPRMGMSDPRQMHRGLLATKHAAPATAGTITLDSYTRVADHDAARRALRAGEPLNGYPIVAHDRWTTRMVLHQVRDAGFPVQVRHGSAVPEDIFRAMAEVGLDATEGGPVSYCLPYSRRPLRESVGNWAVCCELLAQQRAPGREPHLETFGGCMLGQLCPPGLLVALSVLEALFFRAHGLHSVSLSYAQQTSPRQDLEAIQALHRLAGELLPDVDRHIVLYTYMGVYPRSAAGARHLLAEAARLAVRSGAARLIVKTTAEAYRIPTVAENVAALRSAALTAHEAGWAQAGPVADTGIYAEARTIVEAVTALHPSLDRALVTAFETGCLDVPFCLHPDNAGHARSYLAPDGSLRWSRVGRMPITARTEPGAATSRAVELTSSGLLGALSYVADKFDRLALDRPDPPAVLAPRPGP